MRRLCVSSMLGALSLALVPLAPLPPALEAQPHSAVVHQEQVELATPWGTQRVLVMRPRREGTWPVLIALHGRGEARRGPERGFLGWALDYHLGAAFESLASGRLTRSDFHDLVREERLALIRAMLAQRPFEGLVVICPYTPDLMAEPPGSPRIAALGEWVAGPMLEAVRARVPQAGPQVGIDGAPSAARPEPLATGVAMRCGPAYDRSSMEKVPMTPEGHAALTAELQHLKSVERPKISKEIGIAREHGDLRENAEYHAAKEKQGLIEARINEIEDKLARAEVIDPSQFTGDKVRFGAHVTLEDTENGKIVEYRIVGPDEASLDKGTISVTSPVARALIGREPGDEVVVNAPGGKRTYEIAKVRWA